MKPCVRDKNSDLFFLGLISGMNIHYGTQLLSSHILCCVIDASTTPAAHYAVGQAVSFIGTSSVTSVLSFCDFRTVMQKYPSAKFQMVVRPYATAEILSPPSPPRRPIYSAPPLALLAPLCSPACRCSRPSRDPVVIFVSTGNVAGNKVVKKDRTAEMNRGGGEGSRGNCLPGLLYAPWCLDCHRMSRPCLLGDVGACWRSSRWSLWLLDL